MARPIRALSSFGRHVPKFEPQPTILVICEDSKSCRTYLDEAARSFRANLRVEVTHCGKTDPQSIVAEAIDRSKKFDHVYCAIDRDDHPRFDAAMEAARQHRHKITIRASFPAYEYWLLLHFTKSRKPYKKNGKESAGESVVRDLCAQKEMRDYAKGDPAGLFERLKPRLALAMKRADEVLIESNADGNPNPSTTLHHLLREFEKLGKEPLPVNCHWGQP